MKPLRGFGFLFFILPRVSASPPGLRVNLIKISFSSRGQRPSVDSPVPQAPGTRESPKTPGAAVSRAMFLECGESIIKSQFIINDDFISLMLPSRNWNMARLPRRLMFLLFIPGVPASSCGGFVTPGYQHDAADRGI
ncbi:MAG: hypothetical protein ACM3QX_04890 [Syntrophomonadaceae bacterium]